MARQLTRFCFLIPDKDLDEFISGAKHGLIYFSLGSVAKSEALPEDNIKMFIAAFSKLRQRVLWKLGGEPRNDLPINVKVSPWCPQQDILGTVQSNLPKIKASNAERLCFDRSFENKALY